MTAPEFRVFGRRTILLHLSGFPCLCQRRVVGTKSTTSKPLLSYSNCSTTILPCKEFFYFLSISATLFLVSS